MSTRTTVPRSPARRRSTIIAASLASVALLGGCSQAGVPTTDSSFTIGVPLDVLAAGSTFDPTAGAHIFQTPNHAYYESLVSWDVDSQSWAPWLAEEYTISPDGKTATFTLRDDVDFTDGEHLDAAAVKKSLDGGEEWGLFKALWGTLNPTIEVTGEYTLEIVAAFPIRSQHLYYLAATPIVSPAALDTPDGFADGPVGTGPYLLDKLVPEDRISFVRNPDYWNPDEFPFDELTFVAFADKVAALNALQSDQIDATQIEASQAAVAEDAGFRISEGGGVYTAILITDHEGQTVPALGDKRVRQAMNMAFDRESILQELELGYGRVSSQPFLDGALESVPGGDDRYPYDPERAKELLAEAGYPDGFTLPLNSGFSYGAINYEPVIESSLEAIGIDVEWQSFPDGAALAAATASGELPAQQSLGFSINTINPYVPIYFLIQAFDDPEWTELYTAYQEGTTAEFEEAAPRLAEYILDQALYVTLSHPTVLWATIDGVEVVSGLTPLYADLRDFRLVG